MTTPPTASLTGDRRNSIGFLRLLFAGLVVYVHCYRIGGFEGEFLWEWSRHTVSAGSLAVQCFFVLSGALIATSWLRCASLGRYLWHRALRLIPAFWVCLLVTAFVFTPLLFWTTAGPKKAFFELEPSAWGYIWHNLIQPRSQIAIDIYPNGGPWAGDWNGSLWTLFYEGFCYVVIAGFGLAGLLTRWRRLGAAVLLGFVLLYSIRNFGLVTGMWPAVPVKYDRLFDTSGKELVMFFFTGSLWALFPAMADTFLTRRWAGWAVLAAFVTTVGLGVSGPVLVWLLPPLLFWLARVLPLDGFERRVGGDYSYGLYVYNYPVEQVLAHFGVHQLGFFSFLVASLLATGVCAALSWHCIERPALSLKNIWSAPRHRPLQPASSLA